MTVSIHEFVTKSGLLIDESCRVGFNMENIYDNVEGDVGDEDFKAKFKTEMKGMIEKLYRTNIPTQSRHAMLLALIDSSRLLNANDIAEMMTFAQEQLELNAYHEEMKRDVVIASFYESPSQLESKEAETDTRSKSLQQQHEMVEADLDAHHNLGRYPTANVDMGKAYGDDDMIILGYNDGGDSGRGYGKLEPEQGNTDLMNLRNKPTNAVYASFRFEDLYDQYDNMNDSGERNFEGTNTYRAAGKQPIEAQGIMPRDSPIGLSRQASAQPGLGDLFSDDSSSPRSSQSGKSRVLMRYNSMLKSTVKRGKPVYELFLSVRRR
jgi:hypothetical protein